MDNSKITYIYSQILATTNVNNYNIEKIEVLDSKHFGTSDECLDFMRQQAKAWVSSLIDDAHDKCDFDLDFDIREHQIRIESRAFNSVEIFRMDTKCG